MTERRELKLVEKASPCDTDYFDRELLTFRQRVEKSSDYCPNVSECQRNPGHCALKYGVIVAKYVMSGGNLKSELLEFSEEPQTNEAYWNSIDRKTFSLVRGKVQIMQAVERFARLVLLEDPDQSVFENCPRCDGVRLETTVIDSGRDGVGPLSGSGRTRKRFVAYCPSCDPKPQGGTFEEGLIEDFI